MRTALVGYTGFVGGNLAASNPFDAVYNSKNIVQAAGTQPDLLVYAGVPAAKFLANRDPQADWQAVSQAFENICSIAPKQLVLISTVDVYACPQAVDENTPADVEALGAYGRNRARLEQLVREAFPDSLIVRLPALLGKGLKKNFLYDFLHPAPSLLPEDKMEQLGREPLVAHSYQKAQDGFFRFAPQNEEDCKAVQEWFASNSFNALKFTDSRSMYQFYDLSWLWKDITIALAHKLHLVNLTAQPLLVSDIYKQLTGGKTFENALSAKPAHYDMRSIHASLFGGENGYCYSKTDSMNAIRSFVTAFRKG